MQTDPRARNSSDRTLTLDKAREILFSSISPIHGYEQSILKRCIGRVLFEDIVSPIDLPQEAQSSMDGYAFNRDDLEASDDACFNVIGTSWAGRPFEASPGKGECVRIFTGAVLPPGTDSVVIQENVESSGNAIRIPRQVRRHENVRLAGSEIQRGQKLLGKGHRLSPTDLGILASIGLNQLCVYRLPRIAFFSTGDELIPLNRPLGPGQTYDSNRYILYGMLKALGIEAIDLGVIRDDLDSIQKALDEASSIADVILTSGGVSVGEADLIKTALANRGRIDFWKISMKPGKPFAFGRIGNAYFFGLPGNPVSVFVTFYQIVRPALFLLMGARPAEAFRIEAICASAVYKTPGRQEFQRGTLTIDGRGQACVTPATKQESHNLSALAESNCFIVLPADSRGVPAGHRVQVELIDSAFHFN